MLENRLKISRRKFLQFAGLAVLAAAVPSSMVPAAAQKAPAAAGTNPLFTGALGRYEGVSIIHSPGDGLGPWQELYQVGSTVKKVSVNIDGKDFVTIHEQWIPFNKLIRQG
jgi:hypothetical protein